MLATVSSLVDNRFRSIHQGGSIGFTSMLIIVSLISKTSLLQVYDKTMLRQLVSIPSVVCHLKYSQLGSVFYVDCGFYLFEV